MLFKHSFQCENLLSSNISNFISKMNSQGQNASCWNQFLSGAPDVYINYVPAASSTHGPTKTPRQMLLSPTSPTSINGTTVNRNTEAKTLVFLRSSLSLILQVGPPQNARCILRCVSGKSLLSCLLYVKPSCKPPSSPPRAD